MFAPETIQARLRQKPFVPIRFVTSSGESYEVHHPDLVLVGQRDLIIGRASKKNPSLYDLASRVAIMHITAMDDLPAGKPTGNGQ
jgi:hypothetical protein